MLRTSPENETPEDLPGGHSCGRKAVLAIHVAPQSPAAVERHQLMSIHRVHRCHRARPAPRVHVHRCAWPPRFFALSVVMPEFVLRPCPSVRPAPAFGSRAPGGSVDVSTAHVKDMFRRAGATKPEPLSKRGEAECQRKA